MYDSQNESKRYKEMLYQYEHQTYQDKANIDKLISENHEENSKFEQLDELYGKLLQKYQNLEKNQTDLHNLIKQKEDELYKLRQQQDKNLNENELLYNDSRGIEEYYKHSLSQLLSHISYLEETQDSNYEEITSSVIALKSSFKEEIDETYKKQKEILQYKDCIINTKEKNEEYYKDVYLALEKDSKKSEMI